jgi:UDP-N-acetylmuramoyl-tripeptide--D-alanyl-D-alanine ligase
MLIPKTFKQLATETSLSYFGRDIPVLGVSFDTRTLKKGEIFVALNALRDGHHFIEDAINKGATGIIVREKQPFEIPQIVASDTSHALAELARCWKNQWHTPTIALTGSCGKTSTKEMLASIFRKAHRIIYNPASYNNAIGVSVTLFQLTGHEKWLITELGTNHPGELPYLADIVSPDMALITNINASHTEGLGSLDEIMIEKGSLFQKLGKNGIAVINLDDPRITAFSKILSCQKIYYSAINQNADIHLMGDPDISPRGSCFNALVFGDKLEITLPLPGRHQMHNALGAIALAKSAGISNTDILTGLYHVKALKGRGIIHQISQDITLIDETYNASYPSMLAAIEMLSQCLGKKMLILSNMGELGAASEYYHRKVGEAINQTQFDEVWFSGDKSMVGYIQEEIQYKTCYFENKEMLAEKLTNKLEAMTDKLTILIKGSRANQMEWVIDAIRKK